MEPLIIEGEVDTPKIVLDHTNNKFEISGKSLPEDVKSFYNPVIEWLEQFIPEAGNETIFEFKMDYLNTASTKMVTELIYKLKAILELGKGLKVHWYYETFDYDMKKLGADISFFTGVPFEYFEMEED
jgi:hypothetical protein